MQKRIKKMLFQAKISKTEEPLPTAENERIKADIGQLDSNLLGFQHDGLVESQLSDCSHEYDLPSPKMPINNYPKPKGKKYLSDSRKRNENPRYSAVRISPISNLNIDHIL